ncbi:DUF5416 family protein [Campylobacter concisus]
MSLAGLKIEDELVSSIKISISGYDESSDSLDFDLNLLSLSVPYRYAISNGCFEMCIFLKEDKEVVEKFLSTFSYKFEANSGKERYLIVFVNESKFTSKPICDIRKYGYECGFFYSKWFA